MLRRHAVLRRLRHAARSRSTSSRPSRASCRSTPPASERLRGFAEACMFACFLAFLRGDIDDYRRAQSGGRTRSTASPSGVTASCLSMFEGTSSMPSSTQVAASELAADAEPQLLAWTLAHRRSWRATAVSPDVSSRRPSQTPIGRRIPRRRSAAARQVACRAPSSGSTRCWRWRRAPCWPKTRPDPTSTRGWPRPRRSLPIDRTQRRFWSTTIGSAAANSLAARGGAVGPAGPMASRSSATTTSTRNPSCSSSCSPASASRWSTSSRPLAVDLAAIAESGVIAPTATFTVFPKLDPARGRGSRDDRGGPGASR